MAPNASFLSLPSLFPNSLLLHRLNPSGLYGHTSIRRRHSNQRLIICSSTRCVAAVPSPHTFCSLTLSHFCSLYTHTLIQTSTGCPPTGLGRPTQRQRWQVDHPPQEGRSGPSVGGACAWRCGGSVCWRRRSVFPLLSIEQVLMRGTDADGITLGPDEICGCTISVRSNEDILAVWNKNGAEDRVRIKIRWVAPYSPSLHSRAYMTDGSVFWRHRDIIRRVLNLNPQTTMEYK
jgi:hypothetical protein